MTTQELADKEAEKILKDMKRAGLKPPAPKERSRFRRVFPGWAIFAGLVFVWGVFTGPVEAAVAMALFVIFVGLLFACCMGDPSPTASGVVADSPRGYFEDNPDEDSSIVGNSEDPRSAYFLIDDTPLDDISFGDDD